MRSPYTSGRFVYKPSTCIQIPGKLCDNNFKSRQITGYWQPNDQHSDPDRLVNRKLIYPGLNFHKSASRDRIIKIITASTYFHRIRMV